MKIINSFEELNKAITESDLVIAYFTGTDCNVCKALLPKFQEMFDSEYQTIKVNLTENREIAGSLTIFAIPTVIIFVEGKESSRFSRTFSLDEIEKKASRFKELLS